MAPAAAITDHGNIAAMPDLIKESKEAEIKPIVGCEFYIVEQYDEGRKELFQNRMHLCVWAKSWAGVQSIMRQLTLANTQFYKRPLLSVAQALNFVDCMVGSACCFGVMASENYSQIIMVLKAQYQDDFYLEVMPHQVILPEEDFDRQKIVNERAVSLAHEFGVKLLATNDSHYTNESDAAAHAVMMATQYNQKIAEYQPWPPVFFMRDMGQMFSAFMGLGYLQKEDVAQAMTNTIALAKKVDIQMPVFSVNLPRIHDDEGKHVIDSCLVGWKQKLERKIGNQYQVYRKRLVYELEVIKNAGFLPYFCMVQDIISWARSRGIMVGPARGSSAGSLVCYLMDITRVNPIEHVLYFERFLNPERNDLPDIDVDFQDDRRQEVIDYIVERYGRENVGQISTYMSVAVKGSFRDVARAYGADIGRVNAVSAQLEELDDFESIPELVSFGKDFPEVVGFSKRLNGTIRGAGCHACGVVISSEPLQTVAAIERRKGSMVTCWDKDQCEKFGLVKMDILGVTTLSVINQALRLVELHHGQKIVVEDIPLDDTKTIEAFSQGFGNCVFQFESRGMQELIKSLKANHFDVMVACTALYRPGPLKAGLTDRYAKVARGDEYARYSIDQLEPILSSTNGVLVYQEQIMRVFNELAGFTWSEADKMRKIIGKKLGDDAFEEHRAHFMDGCEKNGINSGAASALFDEMRGFASYCFNLSHAVAYTMISFYSMYLKVHYPAIFLSAFMCHADDDGVAKAIAEAKRLNISVLLPDVNQSNNGFTYNHEDGSIVAPLSAIKRVGSKAAEEITKAREVGPFESLDDLLSRVNKRLVNKGVVERLQMAGAMECLGIIEPDKEKREKQVAGLLPQFGTVPELSLAESGGIDRLELEMARDELNKFCEARNLKPLHTICGKTPVVLVLNTAMKGEVVLCTGKGTMYLFKHFSEVGVDKRFIAVASPVKASNVDKKAPPKDVRVFSESLLKREILAIKPKVIYCCDGNAFNLLFPGDKISKQYGKVLFHQETGAYVIPGPSPQYASYRPEDVGQQYFQAIAKIGEIFGGTNVDV